MAKAPPEVHFAVMWSYNHDRNEVWASVRTNRPDVDLSRITPHILGAGSGGGHPKAAGFMISGDNVSAVLRPAPKVESPRADVSSEK